MHIRPATIADAPNIARVHVDTWRTAYRGQIFDALLTTQSIERRTAFWFQRLTQPIGSVLVAESHDLIGFCDLVPSRDPDANPQTVGEIAALYVLAEYWRCGAGRALCDHTLTVARHLGYESITLWVLTANTRAQHFYKAMGFIPDGAAKTENAFDGTQLHEIRYRLKL